MSGDDSTGETAKVDSVAIAMAALKRDVGVWDADVEIRPRPGVEPRRQRGVSTRTLIGDGRWLVVDWRADAGFEGHGLYGWDAQRQCYTGVWVDSTTTSIARATGTWDEAARTMTYLVEVDHGGRVVRYREVTRTVDDDTRIYSNLVPVPGGGEHEVMRITYRRRPA
jgi:Protein of unknown function (DUF1579)